MELLRALRGAHMAALRAEVAGNGRDALLAHVAAASEGGGPAMASSAKLLRMGPAQLR